MFMLGISTRITKEMYPNYTRTGFQRALPPPLKYDNDASCISPTCG